MPYNFFLNNFLLFLMEIHIDRLLDGNIQIIDHEESPLFLDIDEEALAFKKNVKIFYLTVARTTILQINH